MKLILFLLSLLMLISSYASATTYAVIVGVEEYDSPKVNNLTASVDDAERVYTFFLQHTAAENLILLRNKEATKVNILKAMQRLFAKAKADDMIFFYFSGYGSKEAFCPHDISTGALYHTDIRNAFKASHAKTKMCVADACYSGALLLKNQLLPRKKTAIRMLLSLCRLAITKFLPKQEILQVFLPDFSYLV